MNLSPTQYLEETTVYARMQHDIDTVLNKTCCDFMSGLFHEETVKNKLDSTCIEILNNMHLNCTLVKTLKKIKPNYTRKRRKRDKFGIDTANTIDWKNMWSSISNELGKLRNNGKPEEKPVEKTCKLSGGEPKDPIAEAFPVAEVVGSVTNPVSNAFDQTQDNPGNILLSQFKEDPQITNVLDRAIDTYIKSALNPYTLRKLFLKQLEEKTIQMIKQTDPSQKLLIEEVITNKNRTMKKKYCKALCSGNI